MKKKAIKHFSAQLGEMFLNDEHDEKLLDLAHFKMKQQRREIQEKKDDYYPASTKGLKRLRVTASGIEEVKEDEHDAHGNAHGEHEHQGHNAGAGLAEKKLLTEDDIQTHKSMLKASKKR